MAWIHSWWEVFLVQETLGPPTFLIFRWNLEHFADSAFEMVHHRTLLLGVATHSPGREKPRSQGLSTAHGRHHLTLWQGFLDSSMSLLLPFPLHSVPKSGPSPRVEVSWWSNEHSLTAGGLWFSINERRWSEPLDYFPSCNWQFPTSKKWWWPFASVCEVLPPLLSHLKPRDRQERVIPAPVLLMWKLALEEAEWLVTQQWQNPASNPGLSRLLHRQESPQMIPRQLKHIRLFCQ